MSNIIELDTFYKNVPNQEPEPLKNEAGHFNIFKIEDLYINPGKPATYSRRSFFKISLVQGHSKIHYADRVFEVNGSVLVFTNPMVPYHWEVISEAQSGYICIFTEAFFSRFSSIKEYPVFLSAENAIVPLAEEKAQQFKALFSKMIVELEGSYTYKYDLLRSQLTQLIHEAQKLQPAISTAVPASNASERIAGLFSQLLERQFPIELSNQAILLKSPADFARQLNIHTNHLNKALKEITGQTTSQLIAERIVQEAKVLLKSTHWTITEIARGLGFEEPNHFSAFFKTKTKFSPVQFRQKN